MTIEPKGWLIGAQAGCDDQFAGNAVIGLEGAFIRLHQATDGGDSFEIRRQRVVSGKMRSPA